MTYECELRRLHRRHKAFVTACMVVVTWSSMYSPDTTHWVALISNALWIWDPVEQW